MNLCARLRPHDIEGLRRNNASLDPVAELSMLQGWCRAYQKAKAVPKGGPLTHCLHLRVLVEPGRIELPTS